MGGGTDHAGSAQAGGSGGPVRYFTGRVGAAGGRGGNEARRYGAGGDGRTDGVCAGGRDGERCSRL